MDTIREDPLAKFLSSFFLSLPFVLTPVQGILTNTANSNLVFAPWPFKVQIAEPELNPRREREQGVKQGREEGRGIGGYEFRLIQASWMESVHFGQR